MPEPNPSSKPSPPRRAIHWLLLLLAISGAASFWAWRGESGQAWVSYDNEWQARSLRAQQLARPAIRAAFTAAHATSRNAANVQARHQDGVWLIKFDVMRQAQPIGFTVKVRDDLSVQEVRAETNRAPTAPKPAPH